MMQRVARSLVVAGVAVTTALVVPALAGASGRTAMPRFAKGFTTLDYPGAKQTWGFAISPSGEIFGQYQDQSGNMYGFTYLAGTWASVNDPKAAPGSGGGSATEGIDAAGQLVGDYIDATGMNHGFIDVGGVFTDVNDPLASPGKGEGTIVDGVNAAGTIEGFWFSLATGAHGFVDKSGVFTTLDYKAKGVHTAYTLPGGISKNGTIDGAEFGSSGYQGFVYSKGKFTVTHDPLQPKGGTTTLVGIAPTSGEMVGQWTLSGTHPDGKFHGFRIVKGVYHSLNDPSANGVTSCQGVTDTGIVAGYYIDASRVAHAFVWRP